MEAVRSTVLMHCVHKAGGWQPKAAGGWFALLTLWRVQDENSRSKKLVLTEV